MENTKFVKMHCPRCGNEYRPLRALIEECRKNKWPMPNCKTCKQKRDVFFSLRDAMQRLSRCVMDDDFDLSSEDGIVELFAAARDSVYWAGQHGILKKHQGDDQHASEQKEEQKEDREKGFEQDDR